MLSAELRMTAHECTCFLCDAAEEFGLVLLHDSHSAGQRVSAIASNDGVGSTPCWAQLCVHRPAVTASLTVCLYHDCRCCLVLLHLSTFHSPRSALVIAVQSSRAAHAAQYQESQCLYPTRGLACLMRCICLQTTLWDPVSTDMMLTALQMEQQSMQMDTQRIPMALAIA